MLMLRLYWHFRTCKRKNTNPARTLNATKFRFSKSVGTQHYQIESCARRFAQPNRFRTTVDPIRTVNKPCGNGN